MLDVIENVFEFIRCRFRSLTKNRLQLRSVAQIVKKPFESLLRNFHGLIPIVRLKNWELVVNSFQNSIYRFSVH